MKRAELRLYAKQIRNALKALAEASDRVKRYAVNRLGEGAEGRDGSAMFAFMSDGRG